MKDLIKKYLPKTYYADRDSEERIKLFVEHWRRLVKVNQELEQKIDSFLLEAKVSDDFSGKPLKLTGDELNTLIDLLEIFYDDHYDKLHTKLMDKKYEMVNNISQNSR